MKKIVHIITRMDRGGSAQNTLATCRELAGRYRTVLVHGAGQESRMTEGERRQVAAGLERARLRGVRAVQLASLVRRIDPRCDPPALLALCRLLRRESPDLVHTHTSKAGMLGRLAARMAGARPVVHTPHGHVFHGHFDRRTSALFLALERLMDPITARLVALTAAEADDYRRLKVAPARKIRIVHSGVALERFRPPGPDASAARRRLGLPADAPLVGTVGWLLPIKGPLTLLAAMEAVWRRFPQAHLAYVGKGDLAGEISRRAHRLGAAHKVHLLGWRADVADIVPLLDIFVLPSRNEGMGRVLVEAMACGRPLVAAETGGIPDLVRHGENGLLVPPGDPAALGRALAGLLADPGRCRTMGRRGLEMCRGWSESAMVARLAELYQEILGP